MLHVKVEKIMSTDILTVKSNDSVYEVYQIFEHHAFHHLPVLGEDNILQGLISMSDIDRLKVGASLFKNPKKEEYNEALFHSMRACDIMIKDLVVLDPKDSIELAYKYFKINVFHALPVVEKGTVVGMVTPIDILDYFFASQKN